jgi:hypothetical protein
MSELKIEGTIKKIFNTQEVSPKFAQNEYSFSKQKTSNIHKVYLLNANKEYAQF